MLKWLLTDGSNAVALQASGRSASRPSWIVRMLTRKQRMLVTVALANRIAQIVWTILTKD